MSTALIPLSNGGFAIVDENQFEELSKYKWHRTDSGYAKRWNKVNGKNKPIVMHRVINQTPIGMETDHVNLDRLDNRRINLRTVSRCQNQWNRRKKKNAFLSKYKGVSKWKQGKYSYWTATIAFEGVVRRLGYFKSERDAAIAYNAAATLLHGDFARLNVIDENPNHMEGQ